MLDIKLLRKDPEKIEARLKTKDPTATLEPLLVLDEKIRHLIGQAEEIQAKRNHLSKEIGDRKRQKIDAADLMESVAGLGHEASRLNHEKTELEKELAHRLASLPNLPVEGSKVSLDPQENVCIKMWGEKKAFDFPFKNHVELNEKLSLFDFKRAAKTSGSGWPAYCGMGARLEWALTQLT